MFAASIDFENKRRFVRGFAISMQIVGCSRLLLHGMSALKFVTKDENCPSQLPGRWLLTSTRGIIIPKTAFDYSEYFECGRDSI